MPSSPRIPGNPDISRHFGKEKGSACELQLDVTREKLRTLFGVAVHTGQPEVALRETVSHTASVSHVHKKQSGGPGQFADVALRLEPLPRGEGLRFVSEITGGAIPQEFIPSVKEGVRHAACAGVLAGLPIS